MALKDTLERLAQYAASDMGALVGTPREWEGAKAALCAGEVIPPFEMMAPAYLPEVGAPVLQACANECVAFVLHTLRRRAAEEALAKLAPYLPRTVAEMKAAGWSEDEAHRALTAANSDRQRHLVSARQAKFKRGKQ